MLCDLLELSSALLFAPADAVNLPSIRGAVRAVGSHLKDQGLNLLINNAGVSSHATLRSLDSREMLSAFATNVVGPVQVTKVHVDLLGFSCLGRCSLWQRQPQLGGFSLSQTRQTDGGKTRTTGLLCPPRGAGRQLNSAPASPMPLSSPAGAPAHPGLAVPACSFPGEGKGRSLAPPWGVLPILCPSAGDVCPAAHPQSDRDLQGCPQARGLSRINRALVSLLQEFLPLLEKAAKGVGKEGLSCSRAAVINISTKLGSIGLCLKVPEAPMYPYRASKVRCQVRCWGCSAVHHACGEGSPWGHPPPPGHPPPAWFSQA